MNASEYMASSFPAQTLKAACYLEWNTLCVLLRRGVVTIKESAYFFLLFIDSGGRKDYC